MGIIRLNQIKVYAYHGCLHEEEIIGGNYEIDVELHTDFLEAAKSDKLVNPPINGNVRDVSVTMEI